jgi:hypothetical protein
MKTKKLKIFVIGLMVVLMTAGLSMTSSKKAYALFGGLPCPCQPAQAVASGLHTAFDRYVEQSFQAFQDWMVATIFEGQVLPAMMGMTEQLNTVAMQQVAMIGMLLDAKHQLETQRLLQQLTARANKDYHPSEGLCVIGTNVRSLAESDHIKDFNTVVISNRNMQRLLLSGDSLGVEGADSDRLSRLAQFKDTYCDVNDNGGGLANLCGTSGPAERRNKDIDFTSTIDAPLTLNLDFTNGGAPSGDEEDVMALIANLYGHEIPPQIGATVLADQNGNPKEAAANAYIYLRSVLAKRSVAQNSFAAIAAEKSQGAEEVKPFLYAILHDMGLDNGEITQMLGEQPSYFAQMEVLTKKLYQHPNFYTELYDKPVNVARKQVAMQAIDLMQKRDMFRSLLRSEANMSVLLELAVDREQDKFRNEDDPMRQEGVSR